MSERPVLVTGASGFVGAHVARALLEEGRAVRVLARESSDPRNLPEGAELARGDLRDAQAVLQAVRGCGEIYHVAADYRFWSSDPRELYQSNVEGTRHLLDAALAEGVGKFVHTSTVGTIGLADEPRPCDESTPADPGQWSSHYKRSKLEAEELALSYVARGLPVVVVNPSTPIGALDRKPTPTGRIIVDFLRGKIPAYVATGLNFVHVRDVARGHVLAARKGKPGERYILGHRNMPMIEFLRMLGDLTRKTAPRFRIPYAAAYLAGALSTGYANWVTKREPGIALEAVKMSKRFMYFDSGKAVRELGLQQTPVEDAAREAVEWFSRNGYLS